MFRAVEPFKQYRTKIDECTMMARVLRQRGTLKVHIEIGRELLDALGWKPGETTVNVFVGGEDDRGLVRIQKGTHYLLRKARGTSGKGVLMFNAAAVNVREEFERRHVDHSLTTDKKLYVTTGV